MMGDPYKNTRLSLDNNGDGGSSNKSPRNSGVGLFLTLPSNFSLASSPVSPNGGGGRSALSGGGVMTPPHGQGKGISRSSPSHNYSSEDLRRLFLVSLEKMYMLEPESVPFRQPVDPEALGIPDYTDIIRRPMDLQTIRNKMNSGKYTDPWLYVDDVLRMLDNAWVYNREGSKVHQYCSRLAQVFIKEVNPVMNHLGFKQGRTNSFHFNSDTINCHGRPVCIVEKGGGYWRDTARNIEYNLCEQCYQQQQCPGTPTSADSTVSSTCSSTSSVTPDVIPNTPNHNHHHQKQEKSSKCGSGSSPRGSISSPVSSSFEFVINSCSGSYSPAAELHKSHMRDAEMSRQLVLREFLRMLLASDTSSERKANIFKMLGCNGKLMGEFVEYVKRRRNIVMSSGKDGCCVVIGESFTTNDLDALLHRLKAVNCGGSSGGGSVATQKKQQPASSDDSISVSSSDKENDEVHAPHHDSSSSSSGLLDTTTGGASSSSSLDGSVNSPQSQQQQTQSSIE